MDYHHFHHCHYNVNTQPLMIIIVIYKLLTFRYALQLSPFSDNAPLRPVVSVKGLNNEAITY